MTVGFKAERDRFEIALCRGALERDMPVLGDLPRHADPERRLRRHAGPAPRRLDPARARSPGTFSTHEVRLEPGSLAARAAGAERAEVRSHHHQALDRLGRWARRHGLVGARRSGRGDRAAGALVRRRLHVASGGAPRRDAVPRARRGGGAPGGGGVSLAVVEPATEQVMAEVPRAGAEEVDAAVAAAKAAFPAWRAVSPAGPSGAPPSACRPDRVGVGGPRDARGPQRRQADLGRPRRDRHGRRVLPLLRGGARAPRRPHDPGRGRRRHDLPRADGRRRPDRALELPARHHLVEDGARPRRRQHRRPQTRRADSAHRDRARADRARRRPARGRPERRRGPRLRLRQAPGRASRRGEDRLHRLDRGRARASPRARRGRSSA